MRAIALADGLLDETIREGYRARGSDPDEMLDATIELDNTIIAGHKDVTFGIHICRGNHKSMFYASGGYDRIAEQVFSRAKFDRFLLSTTMHGREVRAAAAYPGRSGRGPGPRQLEDAAAGVAERPEGQNRGRVTGRAARAARAQPAVRVCLDARGERAVEAEQRQKLELVAATAKEVWGLSSPSAVQASELRVRRLAGTCRCTAASATNVTHSAAAIRPKKDVLPWSSSAHGPA